MFEFSKKNNPNTDTQLTYLTTVGHGSIMKGDFIHSGNIRARLRNKRIK